MVRPVGDESDDGLVMPPDIIDEGRAAGRGFGARTQSINRPRNIGRLASGKRQRLEVKQDILGEEIAPAAIESATRDPVKRSKGAGKERKVRWAGVILRWNKTQLSIVFLQNRGSTECSAERRRCAHQSAQVVLRPEVVRVEQGDPLAARGGECAIPGRTRAGRRRHAGENPNPRVGRGKPGVIRRFVRCDHDLEIGEILAEHAVDRRAQRVLGIERGDDDRNGRHAGLCAALQVLAPHRQTPRKFAFRFSAKAFTPSLASSDCTAFS